ncbi:MAG: hypothetical protein ACTSRU_16615 [Candidatus Hodarchaeales archaeon]
MSQLTNTQRRAIIVAFVSQQFYQPPDTLINRYNTKSMTVGGSGKVIDSIVDIALSASSMCGISPDKKPYLEFLEEVCSFLGVEPDVQMLDQQFSDLKNEMQVNDPMIFFNTALAIILQSIHRKIVTRVGLIFQKRISNIQENVIRDRLEVLSQFSDDDLSLLFNLEILKEMSRNTGQSLEGYDDTELIQTIVDKLTNWKLKKKATN